MTGSAFYPKDAQNTMEMSGRTNVQAELENPSAEPTNPFGVIGIRKVKKIKKAKKKTDMHITNQELDEFDLNVNMIQHREASTIDHADNYLS